MKKSEEIMEIIKAKSKNKLRKIQNQNNIGTYIHIR